MKYNQWRVRLTVFNFDLWIVRREPKQFRVRFPNLFDKPDTGFDLHESDG